MNDLSRRGPGCSSPTTVLLPGLVDSPVHVIEYGRTEWEDFVSATRAAAAAG